MGIDLQPGLFQKAADGFPVNPHRFFGTEEEEIIGITGVEHVVLEKITVEVAQIEVG